MLFNKEPTFIINGFAELLRQLFPLLLVVGIVNLPQDKINAWNMIISLVLAFVSSVVLRSQVTSQNTANKQIQEGLNSNPETTSVQDVIKKVEAKENEVSPD